MEKSFSDSEIERYIPNIITYPELEHVNPEKLLKHLPVAILYMNAPNHGHWTLLHRTPEGIEFFDSYGFKPDTEMTSGLIGEEYKEPPYLARLLYQLSGKYKINYSPYHFQAMKQGVNTCGRWIILRNNYSKIGIDDFKAAVDRVSGDTGISPDELVVKLTT